MAVGDYNNDIGMIQTAALGVAVANAGDELKKAADHITVGNGEDTIARIIGDMETVICHCEKPFIHKCIGDIDYLVMV